MQQQIKIFLIFMIVFLLGGKSHSYTDGRLLKDSALYDQLQLQSKDILKEMIIVPEHTNFQEDEVIDIIKRLDQLPRQLLHKLQTSGIKVKLFQGKLTDNRTASHLKGIKPRGYKDVNRSWDEVPGIGGAKTVLVKIGHSQKGKGHGSINLELHELGHSLQQLIYQNAYLSGEFMNSWRTEANNLFPGNDYFLSYPEEYFAECFAMYHYSDETQHILKERAPQTFLFFSTLK